jgi:ligand-binding sensor domain-containing protein
MITKSLSYQGFFILMPIILLAVTGCAPKIKASSDITDLAFQVDNLWLCKEQQIDRLNLSDLSIDSFAFPCRGLLKGRNGWIWAFSMYRLEAYDGITWHELTDTTTSSPEIKNGEINFLSQTSDGSIWVSSRQLSRYDPKTDRWNVVISAPSISEPIDCSFCVVTVPGYIGPIFEASDKGIWLNEQNQGIARWLNDSRQLWGKAEGVSNLFPTVFLQSRDESIWMGTIDGVNRFINDVWQSWKFSGNEVDKVFDMIEDKESRIWVALRSGLMMWNGAQWNRIGEFTEPRSIFQASTGDIWIGFNNQGAAKYNGKFLTSYPTNLIVFLETPNHQLFGGGREGLFLYNRQLDRWESYPSN